MLTDREHQCLMLVADGMTTIAIADRLGIAERTVFFHIGNAVSKLGARNRQQAIARAVAAGLIMPDT